MDKLEKPKREIEPKVRIITPLPERLVARVDDYRFARRLRSRTAAIALLLDLALEVENGA